MKEVGDKFGAGELILPFVLQSAEVMKRAVAQLENYLERTDDYTKGTVVLATVFGDVHDIGKSLVNTILTNNGYTVVDLGKQVPIGTIIDAAEEHEATAIGLSALLVSTSKQMPAVHPGAALARRSSTRCSSAARRSTTPSACARCTRSGRESDEVYEPGVFYCKDAFDGLNKMDQIVDGEAREALVAKTREAAGQAAREGPRARGPADRRRHRPLAPRAPTSPIPEPPFWGAREIEVDLDEVYPHLDTHVLFKLHWGGRGVKGEAWQKLLARGLPAAAGAHVARAGPTCTRAPRSATSPATPRATRSSSSTPRTARRCSSASSPRASPAHDRICLADFYRPKDSGELDVVAVPGRHRRRRGHRADGAARAGRRVRRAALRARHRRPDRRGHGRVAARGHPRAARHRAPARAAATPGATPPCPSSPSTRSSSACSTRRRSACASAAATPSSPSSRRSRSSPTTRRPSTSA